MPMKNVGQSVTTKMMAAIPARGIVGSDADVKHVVVDRCAQCREHGDRQFTRSEREKAATGVEPIRDMAAGEAAETQAAHERRDNNRHRINVCAAKNVSRRCQTIW